MNAEQQLRYYSEGHLERAADQIELWREGLRRAYCRDLHDVARLEAIAKETLVRVTERFAGERKVAGDYLAFDVPRRRRWLHAALHILDFGGANLRIDFILGKHEDRERLVAWVVGRGGIYDRARSYRKDQEPPFVELSNE